MKKFLLIVLSVSVYTATFAWGKSAHLIIGQLTDQYLTAKTRAEIKKILGDESLAEAGTWMDVGMDPKEFDRTANWHYVYKDVKHDDDALAKLYEYAGLLRDPSVDAKDKLFALRAFVHIEEDIHCPIHCGYDSDHGGHKESLTWSESGEKTNLHKAWDTDLILLTNKSVDEYTAQLQASITSENKNQWGNWEFNSWVMESQKYLDQAYDLQDKTLTKAYFEKNAPVVEQRLSQAAVRLAFVLNAVFDPQ